MTAASTCRSGVCARRSKRNRNDPPVSLIEGPAGKSDSIDKIVGLELGADDYLAKPFEPRELVARIQNILRRSDSSGKQKSILEFEYLTIDTDRQEVRVLDKVVPLTGSEYQLLLLMAESPGEKFSRDEILNKLKGIDVELFSRAVDIQISRLRQKLKPVEYIKTVWGSGYQFVAPANN